MTMRSQYEHFRAELDAHPVRGRSPRGYVEVQRDDRGEINVLIERGAFGQLTHKELTNEVHGALTAALHDYSRTSERLFQRWGGNL
ncbi:hypothetical protein ACFP2T_37525 [Plantactinospora solaniradicis]|uniref:YbaB/EbfC family DNA-binding protein n=1 Tax=Plantactinospora solaniradicis TaxID=1723736 RepID=A0ABW1KJB5_9ACTN